MQLPDETGRVVDKLLDAARNAFGSTLRSVILYGSGAEGRLRSTSDVNLLFVLERFDEAADFFREPYRFAQAAANVTAMFVLERELSEASDAFAQKFADIQRRHVVLHGEDLVASLTIPRAAVVARLRQVLLNLTLRLREAYVERSLREEQCAITVADVTGPIRAAAASILELEGRGVLPPREALETLARDLGRADLAEVLPHLSEARERRALPAGKAAAILLSVTALAQALHDRALTLEP